MTDLKEAKPNHAIETLLTRRWSPYSFADRDVAREDLLGILEAARWAPSSYNEQPWRYILARRTDTEAFEKLLSCLVDGNQVWAKRAPVLLVGIAMVKFARYSGYEVRNHRPYQFTHWEAEAVFNSYLERLLEREHVDRHAFRFDYTEPHSLEGIKISRESRKGEQPLFPGNSKKLYPGMMVIQRSNARAEP